MAEALALVVELCGRLAEPRGRDITVPIPAFGCSVAEVLERVRQGFPDLAPMLAPGRVRVCVNEAIRRDDEPVKPGDTVALFPPVSGG